MTKTYLIQLHGVNNITETNAAESEAFNIALTTAINITLSNLKNAGILAFDEACIEELLGDLPSMIQALSEGDMETILSEVFHHRLNAHNGKHARAAVSLGIDVRTLKKYVQKGECE